LGWAFYFNFTNKEALLEAVIDAVVGEPFLSDGDSVTVAEGRSLLQSFVKDYISIHHSDDPTEGPCDARPERRCLASATVCPGSL
jgi:AcrR family transcriptional regulator